jgi:hypothetical protein
MVGRFIFFIGGVVSAIVPTIIAEINMICVSLLDIILIYWLTSPKHHCDL